MATLHSDGLPMKLVVYFSHKPRGSVLWTSEICKLWNVQRHLVSDRLDATRRNGMLAINKVPGEQESFYTAGPALIKLIEGMP